MYGIWFMILLSLCYYIILRIASRVLSTAYQVVDVYSVYIYIYSICSAKLSICSFFSWDEACAHANWKWKRLSVLPHLIRKVRQVTEREGGGGGQRDQFGIGISRFPWFIIYSFKILLIMQSRERQIRQTDRWKIRQVKPGILMQNENEIKN